MGIAPDAPAHSWMRLPLTTSAGSAAAFTCGSRSEPADRCDLARCGTREPASVGERRGPGTDRLRLPGGRPRGRLRVPPGCRPWWPRMPALVESPCLVRAGGVPNGTHLAHKPAEPLAAPAVPRLPASRAAVASTSHPTRSSDPEARTLGDCSV